MQEIYLAILAGLGGMFGWGLADFFAKKTVDKTGNIKTLLWMQLLGIFPFCIYLMFNWELPIFTPRIILFLFLLGLVNVFAYLLFYRGLEKGMVSVLAPVLAASGGVAVLVSAFLFGEVIEFLRWIGIAIAFLGTILVAFQPQGLKNKLSLKNLSKGVPEVLASMIMFGFFFPCWDWFLEYQERGLVSSVILLRVIAVISLVVFIYITAKIKKTSTEIGVRGKNIWVWLVLIGLFDALAVIFTAWGYRFTSITSVIAMLSAAFSLPTVILARIFLKEKLAFGQTIGVIGIIGGLIILAI
ncbi:hypothetical protein ES703_68190 [subsurface metagenome]